MGFLGLCTSGHEDLRIVVVLVLFLLRILFCVFVKFDGVALESSQSPGGHLKTN